MGIWWKFKNFCKKLIFSVFIDIVTDTINNRIKIFSQAYRKNNILGMYQVVILVFLLDVISHNVCVCNAYVKASEGL